jgi:hypothetical protein
MSDIPLKEIANSQNTGLDIKLFLKAECRRQTLRDDRCSFYNKTAVAAQEKRNPGTANC